MSPSHLHHRIMTGTIIALAALLCPASSNADDYVSRVWVADQGDGTYINPIIHADYSDPDVIAVGDDFFMTASSFACAPGLPILHSRDLVNWEIVNYAVKSLQPADFYSVPRHGKGVWAPSIRYHNGEYYIYWGDPDWGIFMVKSSDPYGEWEKPVLVQAAKGIIDTTPLWDDDGKAYLVYAWAGSRAKFNSVVTVSEMSPDGTRLIGDPVMVFDGNDGINHTVEGPKFYKRNGYYYILAPAGGVDKGWQIALRSRSPFGPYEMRRVMEQGDTDINGPHQGGLVDTNSGQSWFIHFQDKGLYGRVLHLNPVTWVDDWPVIGSDSDNDGCGNPVSRYRKPDVGRTYPVTTPAESDDFSSTRLGLQWEWHANYRPEFGFPTPYGYMRVYGHELSENFVNLWEVPNLLLQKFPAEEFTVTAKVKISSKADGQQSGLIVMGHDYCTLGLEKNGEKFDLVQTVCHDAEQGGAETRTLVTDMLPSRRYEAGLRPNYERDIYLRVRVDKGGKCTFSYSLDGLKFIDTKIPFTARQGKWIGAKTGIFSIQPNGVDRGWIDIDSFIIDRN